MLLCSNSLMLYLPNYLFGVPMSFSAKWGDKKIEHRLKFENLFSNEIKRIFFVEFDPGSGQTLAACFKHASRTEVKCCTECSTIAR